MMNTTEFRKMLLAQVGKRYIYGAEVNLDDPNPKAFDCSELVQWAYHRAGCNIADGSYNQFPKCVPVHEHDLHVGDLFFLVDRSGPHHVGLYVGSGQCVEAKGRLYGVVKSSLANIRSRGGYWRRYPDLKLAAPPATPRVVVTAPDFVTVVARSGLNVRTAPSLRARVVHVLARGEKVQLIRANGPWRLIKHANVTGWCWASYLRG